MSESSREPVVLAVLAFFFFIGFGALDYRETLVNDVLPTIFRLVRFGILAIYLVAVVTAVRLSELPPTETQTPLGLVASRGIGPAGNLFGEFAQVWAFAQGSQLLFLGVVLNRWDHSLSGVNYWLLVAVAIGLFIASLMTTYSRFESCRQKW